MKKRIVAVMKKVFIGSLCITFIIASMTGCGSTQKQQVSDEKVEQTVNETVEEVYEEPVEEVVEEVSSRPEITFAPNDLMNLVGVNESDAQESIEKVASCGGFKYWKDDQDTIMAVATYSSTVPLWGKSPGIPDEDILDELLFEDWTYKAEYIWYATNEENGHCYCSGIYQKDHYEYVLTLDAETDSDIPIVSEVIDVDLVNEYAKSIGETVSQDTAFAYLHHID